MRRGMAIVLAVLFGWTWMLPAFASSIEANLPACCRKAGKHRCMMSAAQSRGSDSSVATLSGKCPYFPHITATTHDGFCPPASSALFYAGLIHHPALSPQTEAGYRISFYRSRQKRGPPFLPLL
jgi:hypothetical protein